jgi:hypothetical protein
MKFNPFEAQEKVAEKSRTIVKVLTRYYINRGNDTLHADKIVYTLKRKSTGYNLLTESVHEIGTQETIESITNFSSVPDGIYELVITDEHRDWESGAIDDWSYTLVPYQEGE